MYDKRNETPEEKKERLEKHKRLMSFIIRNAFEDSVSTITSERFLQCKYCEAHFDADQEAMNHFFENHKGIRFENNKFKNKQHGNDRQRGSY